MTLTRYLQTFDLLSLFIGLPLLILFADLKMGTTQRISADAALNHEWFREVPLPKSKEFMPTFPAQHAQDRYIAYLLDFLNHFPCKLLFL